DGVRGGEGGSSSAYQVTDLRSGEILKADIILRTDIESLSDEYFIRCGPLDQRAQQYPFPSELVGKLIQSVTAHEAGHAFGIRDAHFGEFSYPFKKMVDLNWLQTMGHTPSIMNYSRHHYIAQPEDSIPAELLVQKVGPLDMLTIKWGYMPIPGIDKPEDEIPFLDTIFEELDSIAWYRINTTQFEVIGLGSTDEVADNDDPIRSASLGLKNLQKVLTLIPEVNEGARDYDHVKRLHKKTLEFWYYQMKHVLSMIGGYKVHYITGSKSDNIFSSISFNHQMD